MEQSFFLGGNRRHHGTYILYRKMPILRDDKRSISVNETDFFHETDFRGTIEIINPGHFWRRGVYFSTSATLHY